MFLEETNFWKQNSHWESQEFKIGQICLTKGFPKNADYIQGLVENPWYVKAWACSEHCFKFGRHGEGWCVKCIFVQNLIEEFGQVFEENVTNFESHPYEILKGIQNFQLI